MVSCHNDFFKPDNILFDGDRVWLVDWEAAFRNDRYAELAVVANLLVSSDEEERTYLQSYFGQPADEYQRARFFLMQQVAHIFYGLVFLLQGSPGVPVDLSAQAPSIRRLPAAILGGRGESGGQGDEDGLWQGSPGTVVEGHARGTVPRISEGCLWLNRAVWFRCLDRIPGPQKRGTGGTLICWELILFLWDRGDPPIREIPCLKRETWGTRPWQGSSGTVIEGHARGTVPRIFGSCLRLNRGRLVSLLRSYPLSPKARDRGLPHLLGTHFVHLGSGTTRLRGS